MAREGYSEIFIPLSQRQIQPGENHFGWDIFAAILARSADDFPAIRAEVQARKQAFDRQLREEGIKLVDHGSPFTQEEILTIQGSNGDSGAEDERRARYILYAILLLVPAINLSTMTQSRLRRRVSEMGVRRAFGCTRWRLVREIITENLLVTLAGGLIGLLASIVMAWLCADTLFANNDLMNTSTNLTPGMLLQWSVFFWALAACFVLNLLSSSIPAWRASRLNPTEAIGGLQK